MALAALVAAGAAVGATWEDPPLEIDSGALGSEAVVTEKIRLSNTPL
jgi:hypothetical protein